jgi:hypothetical protein
MPRSLRLGGMELVKNLVQSERPDCGGRNGLADRHTLYICWLMGGDLGPSKNSTGVQRSVKQKVTYCPIDEIASMWLSEIVVNYRKVFFNPTILFHRGIILIESFI